MTLLKGGTNGHHELRKLRYLKGKDTLQVDRGPFQQYWHCKKRRKQTKAMTVVSLAEIANSN